MNDFNPQQKAALSLLKHALESATATGLLDELAAGYAAGGPDQVNGFCDATTAACDAHAVTAAPLTLRAGDEILCEGLRWRLEVRDFGCGGSIRLSLRPGTPPIPAT